MKPSLNVWLLAITMLVFAGCTKEDIPSQESLTSSVSDAATAPDLNKCKIRRIYHTPEYGPVENGLFTYNKAGNPYSLIYSPGGTGISDHHFFYDTKNRLIQFQKKWTGWVIEDHYYRHNALNQIIIDSAIYDDGSGGYPYETVSTIEYDEKGRVIRETIVNTRNDDGPLDKTRRPTYTYDTRGNIGVKGWKSSSYDYKINPLRQNLIFQFVHRNYSMNNPSVQPEYNSKGLPLTLKPNNDDFFGHYEISKILYDCQ